MAKHQEVLIFYFAFAFTAKKRTLVEVFLQRRNSLLLSKRTLGHASLAFSEK